jgi:thiamine biosynthesis protein ThiI
MVEIRDKYAYIHANQIKGAGGMPVGTAGDVALLVSGGIDSPVAGWMMAKRGLKLTAIHFASPPYTSARAEQKVHSLLRQVAQYSGRINLFVVPFTEIQERIQENCPEDLFTIIMRRFMMKTASIIAKREGCAALITGESVGQVASQTLYALVCTDAVADMPVFRPLIGMDKEEVISISRRIETFDISILPFEDCCTVFTPKHPRTRPKLEAVEKAEEALDVHALINKAANNTRLVVIDSE